MAHVMQQHLSTAFKDYDMNFSQDYNFGNTISPEVMSFVAGEDPSKMDKKDDKQTKKRRSWGQQLPTPTTNLPPR
jgi:hypothetical protein